MDATLVIIIIIVLALGFLLLRTLTSDIAHEDSNLEEKKLTQNDIGNLTLNEFRARVIAELERRNLDVRFENEAEGVFNIYVSKDIVEPVIVDVHNIYNEYLVSPKMLEDYVFRFADLGAESIANARGIESEISKQQLGVVLRHRDYLEFLDPDENIFKPFYGDLISLLVFYHPDFVVNVRVRDIRALKLDKDAAWAVAAENLKTRYDDLEVLVENEGSKWMTADSGLATGHLWLLTQGKCEKNFDSIVVNKGAYVFAEMSNKDATSIISGYAAHLVKIGDTLSDNLISCFDGYFYASRLSGDKWLPIEE